MNNVFFWIGLVVSILAVASVIVYFGAIAWGYIHEAFRHGYRRYWHSKRCKQVKDEIGFECALWLSNYAHRRFGTDLWKNTASDWEKYFGDRIRNKRKEEK